MQIGNIKPGDIVQCDKGGFSFLADVERTPKTDTSVQPRTLMVKPHKDNITYRCLKSTEIKKHWRLSKASTG